MNRIRTKAVLLLLIMTVGFIGSERVLCQTAPTGCPSILVTGSVSGRDTALPFGGCITLRAEVVATATTTDDYTVSSIAYNPPFSFQAGTRINLARDDYYASIINLPFAFCFYGNTYTQACVGANGVVSFNVANNGGSCPFSYYQYLPIPNASFPSGLLNSIYGVCEDIWPGHSTGGGRVYQGVLGTYPCRVACISYDSCPIYGRYSTRNSYQIVIYEGTNIIDVYIKNRNCCSTTNQGNGLVGLQNAAGTKAITAPNRDGGRWSTTNEAWRFTPVGMPNYTVSWYYGTDTSAATGRLIKIDTIHSNTAISRLNVCPVDVDTFAARLKYTACNGDSFDLVSYTVITNNGPKNFDTVVCVSDCYTFHGKTYCTPGTYYDTLKRITDGYDSIYSRITVSDTLRDTIHRTICAGASYDTNGQSYTLTGFYSQLLRDSVTRCYNRLYIDLTVRDTLRDTIYCSICAGASYDTNGQSYTLTGFYSQLLRDSLSRCYNRLYINLTVRDTLRDTIYRTICAGASYDTNGQSYTVTGFYSQLLRDSVTRCYNRLYIDLTVRDTLRDTICRTICAGASFDTNGVSYYNQGVYVQHLRQPDSCYNNLVINLNVRDTFRDKVWQNICAGATFSFGGQSYYLQGTYLQQYRTIYGCDSIVEINLTVNDTLRDTVEHNVCAGQTVEVNGRTYYRDGWYRQNLRTAGGCDSILHIHLIVADTIRDTMYFSVCAGKTLEVNGISYAIRGWYRQNLRTLSGCDSILHIALMVDDTIREHAYDTICDGQIYHYHDSVYTTAGAYRHLLRTPDGCDSIVTMHLFVSDSSVTHIYDTIERGDSLFFFGRWLSQQGVYNQVLMRSDNGCDSTIVLHLKVCHTIFTYLFDTICINSSYRFGDTLISNSGVYTHLQYNAASCDSVTVLTLEVIDYPTLSVVDSGFYCEGGVVTLAAVTNANYITWTSIPQDSSLIGQEHEFVVRVSPQRLVEYIATVDIQPYNCESSDAITLNKPEIISAAMAMHPSEITLDNLAVEFSDISIGYVVSRKWLFHEDDPTTRDRMVADDSIVHYTASPNSDSLEVTLIVTNGYGCFDTAYNIYPIRKGDVWVPSAFTPGRRNAGSNHCFKVGYNNVLDYEINIYSREGMLVYRSTDPEMCWDGTHNYQECRSGSYVYVVRYTTEKHPKLILEQKGSVLLVR